MHDHSRFQRDIDDVTGVSLSLSLLLTKVTHAQYRKRFRASYNIGSASALPIITNPEALLTIKAGPPSEAILVIFGPRALIFFV